MTEHILKSLMRLFAITANINQDIGIKARPIIESYLNIIISKNSVEEYLNIFDNFCTQFKSKGESKARKQLSLNSVKVIMICEEINKELPLKQKINILIQLLELLSFAKRLSGTELDFIKTISESFGISENEFLNCKAFIFNKLDELKVRSNLLIIDSKKYFDDPEIRHSAQRQLKGKLYFLLVPTTKIVIFKYFGDDNLLLNGSPIIENKIYSLTKGAAIQGSSHDDNTPKISPIYHGDIIMHFLTVDNEKQITFTARNIEFRYKKSDAGIRALNFSAKSGQFVGIMGVSGVGKSTLLNIFNGNMKPHRGQVLINGFDMEDDEELLRGVIGFVPQDDLLIEELTVYQNLLYNARLCFSDYQEEKIKQTVDKMLIELDLFEVRHQKVGNPLKNYVSGGQRKRLNIAMELIREPSILLVDEPTSGLSSKDSERVMELLKELSLKGKLVIANIHKPSSENFKLLDKLLVMDTGGVPIYYGNPMDSIVYFKTIQKHPDAGESECARCGNVNTDQILEIIESKAVTKFGEYSVERKISPQEWYEFYVENIESDLNFKESPKEVPYNNFKIRGKLRQFSIFISRNIASKITDLQYLLISFLEAPLLAVILGYFTKYNAGTDDDPTAYIFGKNENIPAYLFMSVVVALFIGLTISAEEIIRDRRTLKRESFLHLSRAWYLNSKILFLFAMSAFQMATYVIISNLILGIKGLSFEYWLVLFSAACFANLLGLNISAGFKSVVTIYILIPFILVPQMLFSGVIVKFDKLHSSVTSYKHVPVAGEIMASRWAYEALAVNQFKNNTYQANLFNVEKKASNASFYSSYLIPELLSYLEKCQKKILKEKKPSEIQNEFSILIEELTKLYKNNTHVYFPLSPSKITTENFDSTHFVQIYNDLRWLKVYYESQRQEAVIQKDMIIDSLSMSVNVYPLYKYKEKYHNEKLEDLVLNKDEMQYLVKKDGILIRKHDPIYHQPESKFGRSHFYASSKNIGNYKIETFNFNLTVIWLMTLFLYYTLLKDSLRKIISFSRKNNSKLDPDYFLKAGKSKRI